MDGDDDYTAVFPVDRPLGINLADVNDRCMVQWVPRGHRAKPGSLLISVNGQSVQHHGFIDTMQMLARAQFPLSLAFRAAPSAHSPIELRVGESGAWEKLHGTLSNGVLRCASSKRSGASADTGAGVVGGTGWDETTVAVEDGGSARLRIPLRGLECTVERRAGQRAVTLLRVPAASASPSRGAVVAAVREPERPPLPIVISLEWSEVLPHAAHFANGLLDKGAQRRPSLVL